MKHPVHHARVTPDKIAYRMAGSGVTLTFAELDARSNQGAQALQELRDVGLDKHLGQFSPAASAPVGQGWFQHIFDPGADQGPICIAGTPYSVYTKVQNPKKLLIMMQGGGACGQDV